MAAEQAPNSHEHRRRGDDGSQAKQASQVRDQETTQHLFVFGGGLEEQVPASREKKRNQKKEVSFNKDMSGRHKWHEDTATLGQPEKGGAGQSESASQSMSEIGPACLFHWFKRCVLHVRRRWTNDLCTCVPN